MLKINRVVIDNFCQHEKVDISLNAGIVSLTGVNGAGKSNLIRALFYGLTGEVLGTDKRADMLRWGAYEGSVTLYVTDGEHDFEIVRTIHNGKHKLNSKKYGKLSKKSEVNELISSLIGLDVKLLGQVVFVPQGKLDDLLQQDHSERVRTFNRLFGLDAADKLRDVLQSFKGKVVNHPSRKAEIEEDDKKIQECESLLSQVKKESDEIGSIIAGLEKQKPLFEAALRAPSYEEVQQLLDTKTKAHEELDTQMAEKQVELETMPVSAVQLTEEDISNAHIVTNLPMLREQYIAANESLGALDKQKPKLAPCAYTGDQINEINNKLKDLQKKRALADAGKCGNCEQAYILSPDNEVKLNQLIELATTKKKEMDEELERYASLEAGYKLQIAAWQEGQHHIITEMTALQKQVEGAEVIARDFDLDAYNEKRKQLDEYHKFAMVREQLQKDIANIQPQISQLVAEIGVWTEQRKSAVTVEIKKQAQDVLDKMNGFEERRKELMVQESSLNTALVMTKERLTKYKAEEDSHEGNTKATHLFSSARDVLHPDMLPKLTGRQAVKCLNKLILKYLHLFHTPFTIELNSDMDFRCGFSGKEDAPVTALSGGQRVVAALACRFALMELLTYGCGLLVLDEPTAYLDTDNKRALLDVLKEAGAHVESQGITVIIPTHEEIVATACTEAITV